MAWKQGIRRKGNESNLKWYHERLAPPSDDTITKMKCCFKYDAEAGCLRWGPFAKSARAVPGERAGTLRKDGYRIVQFEGVKYPVGRIAWLLHTGRWPTGTIRFADNNPENMKPDNFYDTGSDKSVGVLKRIEAINRGVIDGDMEVFALIADGKREAHNLLNPHESLMYPGRTNTTCAHHLIRQYLRHMGVEPEGRAEIYQEPQDEDYRDARTALALS